MTSYKFVSDGRTRRRTDRRHRKVARKPYACKNCPRKYTTKGTLMRHLKFACGDNKGMRCPLCNYRSNWKHHLTTHFNIHHKAI